MPVNPNILTFGSRENITISSGTLTITPDVHFCIPRSESGFTDDLEEIVGGITGQILVLVGSGGVVGNDDIITVIDQNYLSGPQTNKIALSSESDFELGFGGSLTLLCNGTGWYEIGRSSRGAF